MKPLYLLLLIHTCNRYLREESLEVQIWVTYNAEGSHKQRPRNRDKLIGSAYIDMMSLADSRRRQHRVRYVFSLGRYYLMNYL